MGDGSKDDFGVIVGHGGIQAWTRQGTEAGDQFTTMQDGTVELDGNGLLIQNEQAGAGTETATVATRIAADNATFGGGVNVKGVPSTIDPAAKPTPESFRKAIHPSVRKPANGAPAPFPDIIAYEPTCPGGGSRAARWADCIL